MVNPIIILINKIFKIYPFDIRKEISGIVLNKNLNFYQKMTNIFKICKSKTSIGPGKLNSPNRQNYIVDKIYTRLKNYNIDLDNDNIQFLDVGGGDGNVLSILKNKINNPNHIPSQYICLETKSDWVEEYNFDRTNINYMFWDKKVIEMKDHSVDVVLIMVSLHHMEDNTIKYLLAELYRIVKVGGLVLIKEHNASNVRYNIQWEHHLYHIMDNLKKNVDKINIESYNKLNILNLKTHENWKELLNKKGFTLVKTLNRFLDDSDDPIDKNVTGLYWDIFQKNIKL